MRVSLYNWERYCAPFQKYLERQGGQMLALVTPYEAFRFSSPDKQIGIVYDCQTYFALQQAAISAWFDFRSNRPWRLAQRAAPKIPPTTRGSLIASLLLRDGDTCCFCDQPLLGEHSLEHGLDRSNGGTDHLSNLMLAHVRCNGRASSYKNLRSKIEYIVALRRKE